ncbi:MAG: transcriptional regulator GcvA [Alphaproteobacteria bacterium]|nr:transcriptional regulator GcvA [Alphaproteobacteria bacterium]
MARRLPPLNSLRAFEAAARHLSISSAAGELSVTHGAVSRHVAKLELHVGAKLFVRDHQHLALTAKGEAYAKRLAIAFDHIHQATLENFEPPGGGPLRIGIYPTFANHVLIPRLARFRQKFPDIPFQIETSHEPQDPTGEEIDVAVRLGTGNWPDLTCEHLFDEELVPVGSPKLLCGRILRDARDLDQFVLLHATPRLNDWELWLKIAGIMSIDPHRGMRFEHSGLVYQAAVNGLGLAMAQTIHIREELELGRLVTILGAPLKTARSYFLVYPPAKSKDPRIVAFAEWMKSEVAHR